METGILGPELKSIEQLFTGDARYVVPKYQRSFAWGPDEIEEFWEDLLSAVKRHGDYFIGTIVLQRKASGPQEIIDGQQRLVCISVIFSSVRNVFLAAHDSRSEHVSTSFLGAKDFTRGAPVNPKLVLNNINDQTYMKYIIESRNLDEVDEALRDKSIHESNRLLLRAYQYFLNKICVEVSNRGTDSDSFIVPLIDCLRNSVKLITIPVTSEEDANLFFESLNARGKELAISDLVKNRLYSEAREQINRAQQLWEQMETQLGRRPIPEFLRHYWIAKKSDPKGASVREKQLYRMIAGDVKGNRVATLDLLTDLASSAGDYAKISDYNLWPDDDAYDSAFEATLNDLHLFRVTQCNPLLLNAMQNFRKAKEIVRTFRIVANFSFRYFIIGNQSPGSLERASNGIAGGIRTGRLRSAKQVADEFRAINPDAGFRNDFALAAMPKARARLIRYMLSKITNFMSQQAGNGGGEQIANPDAKQVTLEHVLPQNPSTGWRTAFQAGADPAEYVHRIGNLTLLSSKVNRQAANRSFAQKQKAALDISTLAINQYFRQLKKWGDKEIEERQAELAEVALQVWKL